MEPEIIKAIGAQGGYALATVLLAATAYRLSPSLGRAIESRAMRARARHIGQAIDQLNGKLIAAIGRAIEPLMTQTVDRRFDEMPERMRNKIKGIGEHGANGALAVFELRFAPRIQEIDTRLGEQCERLDRVETLVADVGRGVARIEGRLEGHK